MTPRQKRIEQYAKDIALGLYKHEGQSDDDMLKSVGINPNYYNQLNLDEKDRLIQSIVREKGYLPMDPNQALKDALQLFADSKYEEARDTLQPVIEHIVRNGFTPTLVANFTGRSTEEINRLERVVFSRIVEYIDSCVAEKTLNDLIGELPDDTEDIK